MRILFLDLDTLRPDHLSCYGYPRRTSPNMDRIAAEGVRFTNCYCSDAPCLPSRAALMTGRFGIHTGVIGHDGTCADMRIEGRTRGFRDRLNADGLAGVLRRKGFKTVTISPFGERHAAWWFYAGFSEMHNTGQGGMESAEHITPTALQWIQAHAKEDQWFLHINYWDPHTPYRAPKEFGNPFAREPLPAWLTPETFKAHRRLVGPHKAREISMYDNRENPKYPRHPGELRNMAGVRRMIDGYDCGVAHMDQHIGQLFDALKAQGVLEDLVILISSDHGENLGELGIYGEHATADRTTCRIPLIVRWPGLTRAGHVDEGLHYNLDLLPTLAEVLGQEPSSRWDGQSYAAALRGKDGGREDLVLSQCCHVCQRSVRWGRWLYMRTYHDGFHLFPKEMLYDVVGDPHEQHDVATENPALCHEAVYRLTEWHDRMMATMPAPHETDPLWTVLREGGPCHARGQLARYCEYLKKTGRAWAIPELQKRHPREFA